jgi:hypothetical protein
MPFVDVASFQNGAVTVRAIYNANNLKITGLEIKNDADLPGPRISVTRNGNTLDRTYPAHSLTTENIPAGLGFSVVETSTAEEPDVPFLTVAGPTGISWSIQYPA